MLEERIVSLMQLRCDQIATGIGCGCLSLADCPLRNPDDELSSEQGAGPRRLLRKTLTQQYKYGEPQLWLRVL